TEGTRKLKRRELRAWLVGQRGPSSATLPVKSGSRSVGAILARFAPGRTIEPATTTDELGLSSLERVELMMALEEAFQATIDEASFASAATVADLEGLVAGSAPEQTGAVPGTGAWHLGATAEGDRLSFPSWNQSLVARALRRVSLPTWILPLGRIFAVVTVEGLEHLANVDGPVIFAANHQSHFDTPVILDSLPARWRYRVATATLREFFSAHYFPERYGRHAWLTNSLNYYLSAMFFNIVPLSQTGAGTRQTLRYMGELVANGSSILIYPEGRRTEDSSIDRFQHGIGMIASRLAVPVVPVKLEGLQHILPKDARFPTRGRARCAFGSPMSLTGNDYAALAAQVEAAVRAL
ncbi:MAG: 1-acyl-sn-glycerol-3-phosphate acyltransferase, partial [Vicinamibacterales bacterium]